MEAPMKTRPEILAVSAFGLLLGTAFPAQAQGRRSDNTPTAPYTTTTNNPNAPAGRTDNNTVYYQNQGVNNPSVRPGTPGAPTSSSGGNFATPGRSADTNGMTSGTSGGNSSITG